MDHGGVLVWLALGAVVAAAVAAGRRGGDVRRVERLLDLDEARMRA